MKHQGRLKKLAGFAVGLLVASCGIQSAYALNGFTFVLSCDTCAATSDFQAAAKAQASFTQNAGTYLVISASQSSSAYMAVAGKLTIHGENAVFVPTSETPVDENGASLAANTESQNAAYFAALDETVFGADRIVLAAGKLPAQINEPPDYEVSFINSDDAEVGPGIDVALASLGVNWAINPNIKEGMIITVVFQDGTKAQYVKYNGKMSDHWAWAGKAWNSKGKPIDRMGNVLTNSNTGGNGGGNASFNVGGTQYNFDGEQMCTWEQQVIINGVVDSTTFFENDC